MSPLADIVHTYKKLVIQIATPHNTGTGFFLPAYGLIITNEHIIRDNKEVVILGESFEKQLCQVVYIDEDYDLAFLLPKETPQLPHVTIYNGPHLRVASEVIALGHPFGLQFSVTKGIISSLDHKVSSIHFIQHDAALNPGNSGGPLINNEGQILGVNTFVIRKGNNIGFSLPYTFLSESLENYLPHKGEIIVKCPSCSALVPDSQEVTYCTNCGGSVTMISSIVPFEANGVDKTLEEMIQEMGYEVELSRTGPSSWAIRKGSANINISYHEKTGLITGDAHLCELPDDGILDLYNYLLQENYKLEGLTFSIKEDDIILSLLIYDQYFNKTTASTLFQNLFEASDHYDDVLVNNFNAKWYSEK